MKKLLCLAAVSCMVFAFGADKPKMTDFMQRIAVVDMDRLFREYYKTKIVEANLKRQADIYRDYALKLQEEIKRLQAEFIELRDASLNVVLTDATRESKRLKAMEKYRELNAKEGELKDYNREKQAQMRDDQDTQRTKILNDIRTVAKNQAVLAGYNFVLDKNALSVSGLPVIIYAQPAADITEPVLKELNAGRADASDNNKKNNSAAQSGK